MFDSHFYCQQHYFTRCLLLILSILCTISSASHHHHRHRNVVLEDENATEAPKRINSKAIQCADRGTAVGGRCVCEKGYAGTWCERPMHCATFERAPDGGCSACKPNFAGARCERMVCANGGTESEFEQSCSCPAPYSGKHCQELLPTNVYFYYNSKVSRTIGPLGLLAVVPMICIYVICERYARKRQVRRIEKSWASGGSTMVLNPIAIEMLLKEKKTSTRH